MFPESNASPLSFVPLCSALVRLQEKTVLNSSLPERYRGPGTSSEKSSEVVKGLQHES